MRRWIVGGGVVVALGVLGLAGGAWATFGDLSAMPDEEPLGDLGFHVKDTYVGIGVVELGDGHLLLVDAGFDAAGGPLLAALAAHGHTPADVAAVLLTHGHSDHVAGLGLLPDARVYALEAEAPYARGEATYRGPLPRLAGPNEPGARVDELVHDGDVLHLGARRIEVFAVPGHTAGSAAWLVDDLLFLGDSGSLTTDGRLVAAPWVFSDDQPADSAALAALASRLKPRAGTIARLVTSHTGTSVGIAPLLALAP